MEMAVADRKRFVGSDIEWMVQKIDKARLAFKLRSTGQGLILLFVY